MDRKRRKLNITVRPETYDRAQRAAAAADTSVSRYIEGLILGVPYGRHPGFAEQPQHSGSRRPHRKFEPPTLQDVLVFAEANAVDPFSAEKFFHHYASQNWSVGKKKLWDWKERLLAWSVEDQQRKEQRKENNMQRTNPSSSANFGPSNTDWDELAQGIMAAQAAKAENSQ